MAMPEERLADLERRVTELEVSDSTNDQIHWAWRLHRNADSMQHQRHIVFLLVQTALFTGLTLTKNPVLGYLGIASAALWCAVANTLEERLERMRDLLSKAPVWNKYFAPLDKPWTALTGYWVFNWYLPILVAIAWVFILAT